MGMGEKTDMSKFQFGNHKRASNFQNVLITNKCEKQAEAELCKALQKLEFIHFWTGLIFFFIIKIRLDITEIGKNSHIANQCNSLKKRIMSEGC